MDIIRRATAVVVNIIKKLDAVNSNLFLVMNYDDDELVSENYYDSLLLSSQPATSEKNLDSSNTTFLDIAILLFLKRIR